jgi:hypothetical protein
VKSPPPIFVLNMANPSFHLYYPFRRHGIVGDVEGDDHTGKQKAWACIAARPMSIIDLQLCIEVQAVARGIGERTSFGQFIGFLRFLACRRWEKMGCAIDYPRKPQKICFRVRLGALVLSLIFGQVMPEMHTN